MIEGTQRAATPWHLWLVGIFALLFTLYGAYDYTMTQLGDRDYIASAVEPMGIEADAAIAYFTTFPPWIDAMWAIGVWSGVAASVLLLLMRSRYAYPLFVLSLLGFLISNAHGIANPIPGTADRTVTLVVSAIIFALMLAFTLYARSMRDRGLLR